MRLADYVVQFLKQAGIDHVFTVCGGGSIFLCDALAKAKGMKYVACHHEQAAAMAAEGYARVRTGIGAAVVTSGPGGTNAITGVAGAWLDHVPMIVISGQVFLSQTIAGHPALRSKGVQEINIVDGVRPWTKYAVMVTDPATIRYHLEKALDEAVSGRPGPVWLDIPADVQNSEIDPASLAAYPGGEVLDAAAMMGYEPAPGCYGRLPLDVSHVIELLKTAKRPVVHVGQGVRLAGAAHLLFKFIEAAQIPLLTARNANDLVGSAHPLFIGRPGTFAQRGANFAVQTCDLYLAIGTRLSLAQTGYNARDYARNAKVVMVDVDRAELDKDTVPLHLKVEADAGQFLKALIDRTGNRIWPDWSGWLAQCKAWQAKYPVALAEYAAQSEFVNSYHFVDLLSELLTPEDVVVTDMGFAFQNTHQAFKVKQGQRVFTNGGLAAMGWGLPAAVGAAIGGGRRTVCITGDGGLMFNSQELSTIKHHRLPVKIFVLNNGGYLTMRQSQAHAFDTYMGSDEPSGLSFPDFSKLAAAHGIAHLRLLNHHHLEFGIRATLEADHPVLCELMMDPAQAQAPKSINRRLPDGTIKQTAIEDAAPYLDAAEIDAALAVAR